MDCGKCLKNASDAELIKCTSCLTVLHFFCADLSESDFKRIIPMNRKKWKCSACKSKKIAPTSSVSPKTNLASSLNVDTEMLTKYMDTKLADLRQQWRDDLNAAIFEVTRKFRDDIKSLEARMSTWEDRLSQVEDQTTNESLPNNFIDKHLSNETLINELRDRNQREKHVIIAGIPEQIAINAEEGTFKDEDKIIQLISTINPNLPKPLKVFRIGKFNPGKNRRIKVCYETNTTAKFLLRNKSKFPEAIKIYSDLTPAQQKYLNCVKDELARRQTSGESDITIKYIRGIPTIIKINPTSKNSKH